MRLTFILFLFLNFSAKSQIQLTGMVVAKNDKQALSYVNIGVVGKNIGTVTDREGKFVLLVPEANYSDEIRVSMIGYESIQMEVNQLERQLRGSRTLELKPSNYIMEEVVLESTTLLSKKVGNVKYSKNIYAAFGEDMLGNEMGIFIKIKKRPTIIKDVSFDIKTKGLDTARFRLNVYSTKRGKPSKNILNDNVIIETTTQDGLVTVDLSTYNIIVQDDFLITLEWIEDYPEDSIHFGATIFSKPIWVRETSQANFTKVPIIGIGLSATILY
jgi:NifU-like protein involved in Fe-S cluster formation